MARLAALASMFAAAAAAGPTGSWQMLAQQVGLAAYGLGMFNDAKTGVIAFGGGNPATTCSQTLDGGFTWASVECGNLGIFPLNNAACYDTADGAARVAAISGQGIIEFSWNAGSNFSTALGSNNAGGAYIRVIFSEAGGKAGGFGIFGPTQDGNTTGVVVSYDGGLTWTALDATAVLGNNTAVNGAMPTNSTWFMLGAQTPGGGGGSTTSTGTGGTTSTGTGGTTSTGTGGTTTAAARGSGRGLPREAFWRRSAAAPLHAPFGDAGYGGVVLKSQNAGKGDWAAVFTLNGIAPNAVDCLDANNCVMVAQDSAYAYVYQSTNGGASWANTFNLTTAGSILTDVRVTGAGSYLAVGGVAYTDAAGNNAYLPVFIQSADSGATWTNTTTGFSTENVAATGLWCLPAVSGAPCWATLVDPNGAAYVAGTVTQQ